MRIQCPFVRDGLGGEYGILLSIEVKFAHDIGWIGGQYSFNFFVPGEVKRTLSP